MNCGRVQVRSRFQTLVALREADAPEIGKEYFEALIEDEEEAGAMHTLHTNRVAWANRKEEHHGSG